MSKTGLEIILGISNKDGFGPILMVGFGGVKVEKSKDVVFAPVPIDAQGGYELIQKLMGAPLLNEEQYDINSLTSLMASLSDFAQISCEHISEIDLNPILLHPPGQGFSIIDALMFKH
jgi:hypothetical protein